ncbi:MAG: TIGR01212 family radical SAM protein [Desulfatitalea sp.]|nr:TIGR01212 family radical SAM protein [Desulfatitalea sp.]NNK02700.1 TIGR01212 family radical SAM protein [Desulfatitalea sp.]
MKYRYHDLNTYFRQLFGERVHKIAVDAGLTCPNRDGTISTRGCIYCNARGSGTGAYARGLSIAQQLEAGQVPIAKRFKAKKFIAYFQSFSNTYASVSHLKAMYDEAIGVPNVVGLTIGTRPDCVDEEKLALLEEYARKHLVWIELGLQSAHDATLAAIHRGHDTAAFETTVRAASGRGILLCAHLILGLPGETPVHMRQTAEYVSRLPLDGIKLHLLYIIRGTAMETLFNEGGYQCLGQSEYVDQVCDVIERLPAKMVLQRLTSDPHRGELVAPLWALQKDATLNLIKRRLIQRDTWQGKRLGEVFR